MNLSKNQPKPLSKKEFQELDAKCEEIGLKAILLMENAGKSCANFICEIASSLQIASKQCLIVVGPGNNGGDGLVTARHLLNNDFNVTLLLTEPKNHYTLKENAVNTNFKIAENLGIPYYSFNELKKQDLTSLFEKSSIIVDAIFGVGLNRKLSEKYIEIIKTINSYQATKIIFSIDIASGLDADTGEIYGCAVQPHYTLSFTKEKRCFFQPHIHHHLGHIVIFDIGIPKKFIDKV
jgi:hydroxyethylthiazole kinase-like uncharacterized protein yjeF